MTHKLSNWSKPHDMVKIGDADPISRSKGIGDVYVSQTLIAQRGIEEVRREVRGIYQAAWDSLADKPE